MTQHTSQDGDAFLDFSVYNATADRTYLCAYTFTAGDGVLVWNRCPGVIEPGDHYLAVYIHPGTAVYADECNTVLRYCHDHGAAYLTKYTTEYAANYAAKPTPGTA